MSQPLEALSRAQHVKDTRIRQREHLVGAPVGVVVDAIIHPPPELASYPLDRLFVCGHHPGPIPRIGKKSLQRAFLELIDRHPHGRQWWHEKLQLRELTEAERRRFIRALIKQAPCEWRESA